VRAFVITLRPAAVADGRRLAEIDRLTWSPAVTPAAQPAPTAGFFKDPQRLDEVLVAEAGDAVVGYVALHQSIPLRSHAHVLEVKGLAVDPSWRGHGIGRQLVEAAMEEAARRGARKLTLRVLAPNTGARRLYERCGFTTEGVLEGEFVLDGRLVDDVLMACWLP